MSEQADAALQWAQANPQDPRAQSVMAKAWAMKNPEDPRSTQIMQKLGAPAAPSPEPPKLGYQGDLFHGGVDEERDNSPQNFKHNIDEAQNLASGMIGTQALPMIRGASLLSSLGRVGANAAGGAVQGFLRAPEGDEYLNLPQRLSNAGQGAKWGGLISGGFEAVGQATRPISALTKYLGRVLGGVTKEEAEAYARNPKMANDLYKTEKNNPLQFDKMAKAQTEKASNALQSNYIDPRKSEISTLGAGKSYSVEPAQFKGTAAEPELIDAYNKQGNRIETEVPVFEPHQVQASPVEPKISYGKPETQTVAYTPSARVGYEAPQTDVSTTNLSLEKAGKPETLKDLLLPRGSQRTSLPAPMPDKISIGTEPLLRARRAASRASDIAYKSNPLGLSPADTEIAKRNSEAAVNLGNALKARIEEPPNLPGELLESPRVKERLAKIPQLHDDLSEALNRKEQLERLGNPSRIYQTGDLPSNVPVRSLRQYLDQNTGSDFQGTAQSLFAGRALNSPLDSVRGEYLARPGAKALLRLGGSSDTLREGVTNPAIPQAILNSLFGDSSSR